MTPDDNAPGESVEQLARCLLEAIDYTPIAAMDATFYAHYFEELRLIVEAFLDPTQARSPAPEQRVSIVWDCQDPVACYLSEQEAVEARADLQHQLRCTYGPDLELSASITLSRATLEPDRCTQTGGRR